MAFTEIGANTLDTGYDIENSLRFNDDDSAKLGITPGSAGNRKTYTISTWVKRGDPDSQQNIFGTASEGDTLYFDSGEKLRFFQNGSSSSYLGTNKLFRDTAAWYHIVVAVDTNQGTAANRVKLYINGSQYTWDASTTYPAEDYEGDFNNTADEHMIGNGHHGNYFDGYLADFYFIDGTQYAASNFGETNDNGVWIPKKFTGTFGSNGFLCEFKQTGTSANASGIGADTSGNGNHLTPTNLAATDVTTDTPTNNFATLNPLISQENGANTYSEGNCKISTSADDYASGVSTIGVSKGKWYYEVKLISTGGTDGYTVGITADPNEDARLDVGDGNHAPLGNKAWSYGLNSYGTSSAKAIALNSGSEIDSNDSWAYQSGNDIQMVALDMDNNKLYFGENGTWGNSSDPTSGSTGTGAVSISTSYDIYFVGAGSGNNTNSTVFELNFGNPPFSISSGNADANGYGNFEYAPPSGYYALCTKNLAEYG